MICLANSWPVKFDSSQNVGDLIFPTNANGQPSAPLWPTSTAAINASASARFNGTDKTHNQSRVVILALAELAGYSVETNADTN